MKAKRDYPKLGKLLLPVAAFLIVLIGCKKEQSTIDWDSSAPTQETVDSMAAFHNLLPFEDSTDYYYAMFGLVAHLPGNGTISENHGGKEDSIYSTKAFAFCDRSSIQGEYPATVNPSLWRQSFLNQLSGLFELKKDTLYQIRGFDLANMSIVKDSVGDWIVIDPLGSPGTAKAGIDLFNDYIKNGDSTAPNIKISYIIFTHSHLDHFGGVEGLKDYISEETQVVAPEGFFEEAVSENVMAGNCMGRRASYMYGNLLPRDTLGTLGSGLGTISSAGIAGISKVDIEITDEDNGDKTNIGGLDIIFWNAPSSEAPAEMIFYFDDYNIFCQAEDMNHTLHNLLTLRGAKVRNGLKWSKYIDKAIELWGDKVKLSFGSHHWPIFDHDFAYPDDQGNPISIRIKKFWEEQRDLYRFIHDQTLRLANQGYTMHELADMIQLPAGLADKWNCRGYYGTVNHDVKAQYQLYFGWFDGNPANLNPLTPKEEGEAYLKYFDPGAVDAAATKAFEANDYRFAATLWNKLAFLNPEDKTIMKKLAKTYEQLGYQAESGPWRNFYLTAAKELRDGGVSTNLPSPNPATPSIIENMSTELLLDYLAMKFKGNDKAAAELKLEFNLEIYPTSNGVLLPGEKLDFAVLIISNGAVTVRPNSTLPNICKVKMSRLDINKLMGDPTQDLADLAQSGNVIYENGDNCQEDFVRFAEQIDNFNFWFNIVTD